MNNLNGSPAETTIRFQNKRYPLMPSRMEHLERMLDLTQFAEQLRHLIDQPIK